MDTEEDYGLAAAELVDDFSNKLMTFLAVCNGSKVCDRSLKEMCLGELKNEVLNQIDLAIKSEEDGAREGFVFSPDDLSRISEFRRSNKEKELKKLCDELKLPYPSDPQ